MSIFKKLFSFLINLGERGAYDNTSVQAATTARIEKKFQDNLSRRSPVIAKFKSAEGMQVIGGGTELSFPVITDSGNAQSYRGDDVLPIGRSTLRRLTYNWSQFAATVTIHGLEDVMNEGDEAAASVEDGRMEQAEVSTVNAFETMFGSNGEGNVGADGDARDWNGLQNLVSDTPTVGTIGGLSRVSIPQVRNQAYTTAVTAFNTTNNGRTAMTTLYVACCQGGRKPNFIPTTPAIWVLFELSLTTNERVLYETGKMSGQDSGMISAGIPNIGFMGAPVVFSDGIAANHLYMLRVGKPKASGAIFMLVSRKRNFSMGKWIEPNDKDMRTMKILTAGQLATDAPYLQGVVTNITG